MMSPAPGTGEPMPERTPGGGERGVRPYLLTRGRTRSGELAGFETMVVVTELGREGINRVGPEHAAMLRLAKSPVSIAELSARLTLALGVTQVLAGDLVGGGMLAQHAGAAGGAKDPALLRRVISAFERI